MSASFENIDPTFNIGLHVFGFFPVYLPLFGGTVVPNPDVVSVVIGAGGSASLPTFTMPAGLTGAAFYTQWASFDVGVPPGEFAFSNAQSHIAP